MDDNGRVEGWMIMEGWMKKCKTENHHEKRWATYLAERSASSMAYATVFGCYFTSGVWL